MFKKITKKIFGKSSEVDNSPSESQIGHFLTFKNDVFKVDEFGPAKELDTILAERDLDIREVFEHVNTEVLASKVQKKRPTMEYSGGEYAEKTIELMEALASNDLKIFEKCSNYLLKNSALEAFIPSAIAADGQNEALAILIKQGLDVNSSSEMGMSPLHWAAANTEVTAVKILIEAGANCTENSWLNINPAEIALLNGDLDLAQMILPNNLSGTKSYDEITVLERLGCKT